VLNPQFAQRTPPPHPDQQGGRKLITDVAVGKADFMDGIAAVLGRGNKTVGAR
jgi:hypothetical protein